MPEEPIPMRKLTHKRGKQEQRAWAASLSVAERLQAAAALTRRLYQMRGIDIDAFKTDLTPRRTARRKG